MEFLKKCNYLRLAVFVFIIVATFFVFFSDGYFDWINSDTSGEAYGTSQDIRFPQGLFSEKAHRARITGHWLSYVPFHVVGSVYEKISHDPVESLYVSQGVMSATIYVLFVLISAAYISLSSKLLSTRYLISSLSVLLLIIIFPSAKTRYEPFGIFFRFNHQAVMTNYLGTTVVALFALFPYWRHMLSGDWDDFYEKLYLRIIFYVILTAAVVSSTATTIWLTLSSFIVSIYYIYNLKNSYKYKSFSYIIRLLRTNTLYHPLYYITILGIICIYLESLSERGSSSLNNFNLTQYIKVYFNYFVEGTLFYVFISLLILIFYYVLFFKKNKMSEELRILFRILPWLFIVNIIFVFVIGIPDVPRYSGYNLGRSTTFIAVWTSIIWFSAVFLCFWRERAFMLFAPLLIILITINAAYTFKIPNKIVGDAQKFIFYEINKFDKEKPENSPLFISWKNIAFDKEACEEYSLPMLRDTGIVSDRRRVVVF